MTTMNILLFCTICNQGDTILSISSQIIHYLQRKESNENDKSLNHIEVIRKKSNKNNKSLNHVGVIKIYKQKNKALLGLKLEMMVEVDDFGLIINRIIITSCGFSINSTFYPDLHWLVNFFFFYYICFLCEIYDEQHPIMILNTLI